jgi:methionyl-tRNA formyltransferase
VRVLVSGQKTFGKMVCSAIADAGHEVVAVACPVPGPDALLGEAKRRGYAVIPAGWLRAGAVPRGTDIIVAAHSHDFVGKKTRNAARYGAIGFHPSLLPRHRGRDAIRWAIKMGDPVTGGTVYWLNDTVDGGPISAQGWCWIRPGDDALKLWIRDLQPMGVRLILRVLEQVEAGRVAYARQDAGLATWEPSMDGAPRLFRPELTPIGDVGLVLDASMPTDASTPTREDGAPFPQAQGKEGVS